MYLSRPELSPTLTQSTADGGDSRWDMVVSRMVDLWKVVCMGCGILLPLSFGFFQIGGVSENTYARTGTLSVYICSGMGLITGIWYIYLEASFRAGRLGDAWVKASVSPENRESVDFWTYLSLPFSLLGWSILFSFTTFTIIVYVDSSQIPDASPTAVYSNPKQIMSIIFLSALTIGHFTQVYRSIRYVIGV
ncbi:hypothetical protein CVT25_008600 [Psilocybe cyanescens]|uniref:Uncharacterized protein n=1 Tax=Psilocybe cyanescens TaxID=93625 RepID=A0A409XND6_PSICY|nr:hypothetical protein CVT25_008600 [Psilocybe cyanescens]